MANIQHGDGVPDGFSVGEDAERAPRTYTWTKEEIDIANCSFYELAEVYSTSKVAPRYPIDQLAIRLCVRHGTTTVPLKSRLLSLDVQPEHVALTWGCSPRGAKTPATLCYVAELVAKNPQTGGFAQRISSKATFVVNPADAPVRQWEFDDSTQVPPVIRAEVAERSKLDGCDVDGQPWEQDDDEFAQEQPPRGRGRHPDEFVGQGDHGGYGGAQQPYGAQGYPAPYSAPGRAPYGAPGHAYGGTGPAGAPMRGPSGEDLYTPQGWAFSPQRLAEIRAAEDAAAKQKEADAKQAAVLAELEAIKRQQEAERRERDAEIARLKADAERREAERREAERREAERRERDAEIARLKAEADARSEALRRELEAAKEAQRAQTEAIMQQLRDLSARAAAPPPPPPPAPNFVELVSAAAAAAAPIVTALSANNAANREAESRRIEAAAADARAARDAAAEADRRRYEAQQAAEQRRWEEQKAAEQRRWEEEKAARAHEREMALAASRAQKRLDGADPNAAVLELAKELRASIAQAKQAPKGAEGASSLLEKAREFVAIRKLLGLGGDDDKVEDALADPLVAVEKVAEKLEGPLTVVANIVAERLKVREPPRKGGYVVVAGPLGESLAPALRGRMPNGVEVDISDDHVMLPDGNLVHISMYHATMAQRAAMARVAVSVAQPQPQPDPLAPAPFPHPGAFDPPPFVQPAPLPPAPFAPAPLPAVAQVASAPGEVDVVPVRVPPFRGRSTPSPAPPSAEAPAPFAEPPGPPIPVPAPFAEPPGPPIPVPAPFVEPPGPPIPVPAPFVEPLAHPNDGAPRQLELPSAADPHPDEPKGG